MQPPIEMSPSLRKLGACGNGPVAFLALVAGGKVRAMAEADVAGNLIDPDPLNRAVALGRSGEFLNVRDCRPLIAV